MKTILQQWSQSNRVRFWPYVVVLVIVVYHVADYLVPDFQVCLPGGIDTTRSFPLTHVGNFLSSLMWAQLVFVGLHLFCRRVLISLKAIVFYNSCILTASTIMLFSYIYENAIAWYGEYWYDQMAFYKWMYGTTAWLYWVTGLVVQLLPQLFWKRSFRQSAYRTLWIIGALTLIELANRLAAPAF